MKNEKTFLQILLITLAATIASHFLILLNNGAMWDSLLLVNAKQFGYNSAMKNCIFNTGRRMEYYIALIVFYFPNYVFTMKVISFCMIWFCTVLVYKILDLFFENKLLINLGISVLSISFPIYSLWFEPIMFSYTFCMLLFFLAIYIYLNVYSSGSIVKKILGFSLVAFLLFWSFEIQSFYVFIYAVLFALFVKSLTPALSKGEGEVQKTTPRFVYSRTLHNEVIEDTNLGSGKASKEKGMIQNFMMNVVLFLKQHFFIILFPVFSFWLWNKLFPISGMAKMYGYNQISFSVGNMLYHFGFSCFKLFAMLPYLLLQLAIHNPITTMVSIAVSALAAWYFFKNLTSNSSSDEREGMQMKFWVIAIVSFVFFVAAFLPYNMVGKDYGALNRNCRNGLLAGFGIVIFLVLSVQHFIKTEKYQKWIFTTLFVLFALGSNLSYMYWQAYYVRFQKAEQLFAQNLPHLKNNYLLVSENCKNPMHQYFVYYEYNFMCKEACGYEKYLALDKHSGWNTKIDTFIKNTEMYKPIFMFKDFDNKIDSVTEIELVSPPNTLFNAEKIVAHYWLNNYNAKDYPMNFFIR
ncbi:MAG: hypothetical protein RL065_1387 [Bacteroidota bacterium]